MRKLIVFNNVSLDGYIAGVDGDISWTKRATEDPEFDAFVQSNASGGGVLVFGRITYDLMARYWPTPQAMEGNPIVAQGMNNHPKIVFSKTLDQVSWHNTTLVKGDPATEMRRMKNEPGEGMAILGSGSIVAQLAQEGLIDEYQVVVNPVVLGGGKTMFEGITEKLALKLIKSRAFGNGNVLLCYEPMA